MMRWLWPWRKADERAGDRAGKGAKRGATPGKATHTASSAAASVASPPTLVVERGVGSGRLGAPTYEPRDALLSFARDFLRAQGAQVRVEDDDLVTARLASGAQARYTTTLARARAEADTTLLVEGSAALATLYDEAAQQARMIALALAESADPVALVGLTPRPPSPSWGKGGIEDGAGVAKGAGAAGGIDAGGGMCGRCVGLGGEGWLRGTPSCAACPLREGRLALRWAAAPLGARVTRRWAAVGVEMTYRIGARDRRGRRDEWLRLTFDTEDAVGQSATSPTGGQAVSAAVGVHSQPSRQPAPRAEPTSLTPEQIAQATAVALPTDAGARLRAASGQARRRLAPALEATSAFLQQSAADDYQRRIADLTARFERLRRETPDQAPELATAQTRELAGLAEVYAVEVEAALENVAFISTPMIEMAMDLPGGGAFTLTADLGRGVVAPPTCRACGAASLGGFVGVNGDFLCTACGAVCTLCGAVGARVSSSSAAPSLAGAERSASPQAPAALTACATCGELTCDDCLRTCAQCGGQHCADHVWACKECAAGATLLCLACATLCARCDGILCATHTRACSACGESLCGEHALACGECARTLCDTHARRCVTCQRPLCADHAGACEECGAVMCARDTFACLGCGRDLCRCAAPVACAVCQVEYCVRCLGASGASAKGAAPTCPACRALAPTTPDDLALLERAAAWEREALKARDMAPPKPEKTLNVRQQWLVGRNERVSVFASRSLGRQTVYVVAPDGAIIHSERKGWRS